MKVSILINNYNYGRFIKETINSVLSQDYDDLEVIVYDDGSTDNSLELLNEFCDKIKIVSNKNYGKAPSLNQAHAIEEAFNLSTGDIICLLDSDDLFAPNKIETLVSEFIKNKKLVCIQHTFQLLDQNSKLLNKRKRPIISGVKLPSAIYFTGRLDFFFTQTSGLSFTRECLNRLLPFKEDNLFKLWPDLRLTREACFIGEVLTLQKDLGYYRMHGNNDSDKLLNVNFLKDFQKEHFVFFNRLSTKYAGKEFKSKSKIASLILLSTLLLICKMSLKEKCLFLRSVLFKK
jgi:glycosyltransferase involved in cell wall biosynthesis